jgi:hypothetical protein
MTTVFRSPMRCRSGVSALELGLIAPVLATMAVGLFEYFGAAHQAMELAAAARAGAEYAMSYPSDSEGIQQAVVGSGKLSPAGLAIDVAQICECPDGTPIACGDVCAGGVQSNVFMRVALSQPARSILAASGFMPDYTLSGSAMLRVR